MYKDIVVCINEMSGSLNTINKAALFSHDKGARLTGLYVRMVENPPIAMYGALPRNIITQSHQFYFHIKNNHFGS